jgi:hypothetical protein
MGAVGERLGLGSGNRSHIGSNVPPFGLTYLQVTEEFAAMGIFREHASDRLPTATEQHGI